MKKHPLPVLTSAHHRYKWTITLMEPSGQGTCSANIFTKLSWSQLQEIPLHHAEQCLILSSSTEADQKDQAGGLFIINMSNRYTDLHSQKHIWTWVILRFVHVPYTFRGNYAFQIRKHLRWWIQRYLDSLRLGLDFSFWFQQPPYHTTSFFIFCQFIYWKFINQTGLIWTKLTSAQKEIVDRRELLLSKSTARFQCLL